MTQQALSIEIDNSSRTARLFEIIPGLASWLFILSPILLSLFQPVWVAYLIIAYDLLWLTKAFGLSYRLIKGYRRLNRINNVRWRNRLSDLDDVPRALKRVDKRLQNHRLPGVKTQELRRYRAQLQQVLEQQVEVLKPASLHHAIVLAIYNESLDILEPTVKALAQSDYPLDKLWLFIAYEQRGGPETKANAEYLIKTYGEHFGYATAVMHPENTAGEIIGKGGNITYAGRRVTKYAQSQNLNPEQVIVTTLDSDNRPGSNYFSYLSFIYATAVERVHKSYQPVPMFYNNIWDVPAPMRVIATGNTFWMLMETMRPHRLRNFSAHAQSLQTLIDTDYWSVKTVVEDGHQFWRTYFTYDGRHQVIPIYVPVFQDAVLARGYWRTMRAQFIQLRRWAWGASDISYMFVHSWRNKKISLADRIYKFFRLFEGHFSWATAPLVLAFAAWFPLLLNPDFNDQVLAHQLPLIASRIQTIALIGVAITILVSLISLPPRPAHYRRHRSLMMILQWVLLPVTTILFSSLAALNAQTRLMFGWYLEKFDVTEKAVKK